MIRWYQRKIEMKKVIRNYIKLSSIIKLIIILSKDEEPPPTYKSLPQS